MHWCTYSTSSDTITLKSLDRTAQLSGYALYSYLGCGRFEFMQGQEWPWLRPFVLFLRFLSQISVLYSDWATTASFQIRSCSSQINQPVCLSVTGHCTQCCALHRQLQYTRCKKMKHGRFHSWGFCCVVAGVLSDVSNKIGNGVKNSTSSTWLVRIKESHCFETSAFATQWHGVNCTAVIAPTSQISLV